MKKWIFAAFLPALLVFSAYSWQVNNSKNDAGKVVPVSFVDLKRYAGKWYEIAHLPNRFQKDCAGNTTATYTIKERDEIEVLNQCLKKNGEISDAKGKAKVEDKKTNAKLEVRFAPRALSFIPGVWGDYWVIDLEPNYQYAVVGHPNRKYLWILSRAPEMSDATYQEILRRVEKMGYAPNKLMRTAQNLETINGTVIQKQ